MTPEQRYKWRLHVLGAKGLPPAQRLVILALENYANWSDGTNAHPGVDKLARTCGVDEKTVRRALETAWKKLGLIEQTVRANPKAGNAAVWKLVSTGLGSPLETDFNRTGKSTRRDFKRTAQSISSGLQSPPTTPRPHQKRGLRHGGTELDDPDAYAINPVSQRQSANGDASATRCAKHAHIAPDAWVGENCHDCAARRKAAKASEAERKSAAIQTIKDCPHCDDLGRVEIVTDGIEELAHCLHHVSWAQAQGGRTA